MSTHQSTESATLRASLAGLLTWVLPGLGHIYLGYRNRGLVFLVTITATFWSGVAIGGGRSTVDPKERKLWFMAQLCTGGNTLAAWALNQRAARAQAWNAQAPPPSHWMRADVGVHYTGVAGLLNLLIILDAITRAEPSGSRKRELRQPVGTGAGP